MLILSGKAILPFPRGSQGLNKFMLHHCKAKGDKSCYKKTWVWSKVQDFKNSGEENKDVNKNSQITAEMIVADLASSGLDFTRETEGSHGGL